MYWCLKVSDQHPPTRLEPAVVQFLLLSEEVRLSLSVPTYFILLPPRWLSCVMGDSRSSPWLNFGPLLCRTGRVQSAEGCATAACVARRRAAAPPETWWDWPASTATTTSTSTWKGGSPDTVRDDNNAHVMSSYIHIFFCLSCFSAFRRSCSEVQKEEKHRLVQPTSSCSLLLVSFNLIKLRARGRTSLTSFFISPFLS